MTIILDSRDFISEKSKSKRMLDIQITDFRISMDMLNSADMIIYQSDDDRKIYFKKRIQ